MHTRHNINIFFVVLLPIVMVSEAKAEIFKKAEPAARNTNFVVESIMYADSRLPFNKVWKSTEFNKAEYTEIYVAPVNTDYVRQNSWWTELNIRDLEDDLDKMAAEFRSKIRRAFWDSGKNRYRVVNKPGPNTLILELAITEIIPNKAGFEVMLAAAGPASGKVAVMAGGKAAGSVGSKSTIAIEARVRAGDSGDVVAMFADREQEKSAMINIKNFTWYGQVYVIMDEWAQQFVKAANKSPHDVLEDTPKFTFKPW